MGLLLLLVLLLIIFALVGGFAVSNWLFVILIIALILLLVGYAYKPGENRGVVAIAPAGVVGVGEPAAGGLRDAQLGRGCADEVGVLARE